MMNLTDYGNLLYGAYHSNPSGNYARTAEEKEKLDSLSREDFVADMQKARKARWGNGGDLASKPLLAGSAGRTLLSDTEIAALANKYDVHSLDQKSYDSFLDDLADMGAISEQEKGYLGYGRLVMAGYSNGDGNLAMNGSESHADLKNSKIDLVQWLSKRVRWETQASTCSNVKRPVSSEVAAQRENEMFASMNSIVNRMLAVPVQRDSGEMEQEECDIIELVRDPNSTFYQDMFSRMKIQLEESEEEKKKQAIIDALDAVLQSLSEKKDTKYLRKVPDSVSSMAELAKVIDSLDKRDPRKEQLSLLFQQAQNLGIYLDLDLGVERKKLNSWSSTLTQQLIQEEKKNIQPNIFDII